MLPLADALPPGYVVRFPGLRPDYAYDPYHTDRVLHRFVVVGLNEFYDPETRRVWAPDRRTAQLIARQHLTSVSCDGVIERTVEPPGLD